MQASKNDVIQFQGDFIQMSPLIILELGNLEVFEEKLRRRLNWLIKQAPIFPTHRIYTSIWESVYSENLHWNKLLPLRWYEKEKILFKEYSNQPRNNKVNFVVYLVIPC